MPAVAPPRGACLVQTGLLVALLCLLAGCQTLPAWMVVQARALVTDYRHFDNAPMAPATTPWSLPVAPRDLRWPGGLTLAQVQSWAAENDTLALLVLQRGQLVYEGYYNGFARESIGTSFSASKSVVSLLVGVAMAEGRIASVDDPVTRYLPQLLRNDPRFGAITLRHLLQMRSGIAFDEGYGAPWTDASHFYLASNIPAQVAKLGIARPPGQAYAYQSGDTQLLGMALERAVRMPLADYAQAKLWQPMGAEFDASWSLDSANSGVAKGFCCLNARAVDFARLGQLVLQGGERDGKSIVPAEWLRASTAAQRLSGATDADRRNIEDPGLPSAAFYAWQWRRSPLPRFDPRPVPSQVLSPGPHFYAEGLLGQFIFIAPEAEMVVVRLGGSEGGVFWPGWMDALARQNP